MSMIAATAPMLDDRVARARAWFGPALRDSDFVVGLPDACLAELDQVVAEQRKAPVPTLMATGTPKKSPSLTGVRRLRC